MRTLRWIVLPLAALLAGACSTTQGAAAPDREAPAPTAEEARAFIEKTNQELKELWIRSASANWVRNTHVTEDTVRMAAWAREAMMAYSSQAAEAARRFDGVEVDAETRRALEHLRLSSTLPAPSDPGQRSELASVASEMSALYSKGKWCGPEDQGKCQDLGELSEVMAKSQDRDELLDAWVGWRTVSPPMRPLYEKNVALANAGARELGFADLGELWRSGYDMPPEAFEAEVERLWTQVQPLYEELHCYTRSKLEEVYGADALPADGTIPAHLTGNMWAQDWSYLYPVLEPYRGHASLDVDKALVDQGYDALRMAKMGEAFFTSMGFPPMPETYWTHSMLTKPRDREVECHASAWNMTTDGDIRMKMCIKPTEEDLVTIHHELGHNFYYQQYLHLPPLFQSGAHDGFHEAIGDAIALSITPGYLQKMGLIEEAPTDDKGLINFQMKMALGKIAFLPFGKLMDQWRWGVFSGEITPERYNEAWWELRQKYQGVSAPVERSAADFDPGAKYHIPANVPYMRYFLAHVLQFQMHEAMCEAAGFEGRLADCSVYGSEKAGEKLRAMLAMGSSRPWPEALEAVAGTRDMDAEALLTYFAPLREWLKEQNQGKSCGW